ncbi:MAG: DsrE/DsrF/DrsH-like family protein [Candidatus Spechtbacterales bacterium]|nr:DsrE/DsrF/DrsH-like family protein [Candidatus Spechtbacterales bacterium]
MEQPPIKKISIILSKATIENAYAAMIMAHGARSEGIEANLFFTFFGLEVITKDKLKDLRVATVGNPAMHIPSLVGILPGMQALGTKMMKKQMEKLDVPDIDEFLEMLDAEGVKFYACKMTYDMFNLQKEDLWEGVSDVVTVGNFYQLAGGDNSEIVFV